MFKTVEAAIEWLINGCPIRNLNDLQDVEMEVAGTMRRFIYISHEHGWTVCP